MEQNNDMSALESLLRTISFPEIIVTLTDVDNKIISLHECSNEDFLIFNSYLKKYNKVAEEISTNINQIFMIISGESNRNTLQNVQQIYDKLEVSVFSFEKIINRTIEVLNKILSDFDKMFVPLKNFNQELLTLRFINSNLKFNITYFKPEKNDFVEVVNTINDLIANIKLIYPDVDALLFQLKGTIKGVLEELYEIKEHNLRYCQNFIYQIRLNIELLNQRYNSTLEQIPKITQKTKNYFDSIEKIITNLQYHDIIRQKMEHIQKSHRDIIEQLKVQEITEQEQNSIELKINSYIKLRDISGLQVAQLIHTNKQYQTAIEIITQKFIEISDDINSISVMCRHFTISTGKTDETHFLEIETKLQSAIRTISELAKNYLKLNRQIETISEKINFLNQSIEKLSSFDAHLDKLVMDTVWKSLQLSPNQLSFNTQQIKTLANDVHLSMQQIQNLFCNTSNLSTTLNTLGNKQFFEDLLIVIQNELNPKIAASFEIFNSNDMKIRSFLEENNTLSMNFSTQIKASIEQVRYYDFFEHIIEDIILKLNHVYQILKVENLSELVSREKNLADILENYTTHSEHLIHNFYTQESSMDFINDINKEDTEVDDTENIELF